MKKIYISQPTEYLTDEEISQERKDIISYLKATLPYEFVILENYESYYRDITGPKESIKHVWKLLGEFADADIVVLGKGWEASEDCKLNKGMAECCGIKVLDLSAEQNSTCQMK